MGERMRALGRFLADMLDDGAPPRLRALARHFSLLIDTERAAESCQ